MVSLVPLQKSVSLTVHTDCEEPFDDTLQRGVHWKMKTDLAPWIGQTVRVHFTLRAAERSACRFHDGCPK